MNGSGLSREERPEIALAALRPFARISVLHLVIPRFEGETL
jgi:hypothetical protein